MYHIIHYIYISFSLHHQVILLARIIMTVNTISNVRLYDMSTNTVYSLLAHVLSALVAYDQWDDDMQSLSCIGGLILLWHYI